jgi:hypothetical protein
VKNYIVYYMDCVNKKKVPVGSLVERRHEERGNNSEDILLRARQLYGYSPIVKTFITVDCE